MQSRRSILTLGGSAVASAVYSPFAACQILAAPSTASAPAYGAQQGVDASVAAAGPGKASRYVPPQEFWLQPRFVHLRRLATGQVIKLEYWRDGVLDQEAYRHICWFLRDLRFEAMLSRGDASIERALRSGQIRKEHLTAWVAMDPILIDILYAYCAWLQYHGIEMPLDVTSAFRHFLTNAMIEGAALNSQHPRGRAADVRVPKISVWALAAFGRWLSGGGVGVYAHKDFVHLDSGRVRSWRG